MPLSRSLRSRRLVSSSSSGVITVPSLAIRSGTSMVFSSAASGSGLGQMIQPARPPGTNDRAICSTCRKPWVVTSPTTAPLPSRIALVPTVVPCSTWAISVCAIPASSQTFPIPRSTPMDWSWGVDAIFVRQVSPLSEFTSSTSVNVPPTSTPSRKLMGPPGWGASDHGLVCVVGDLIICQAERALPDLPVVLAECRSGGADFAGGAGEPGRDVLHRQFAEFGVHDPNDRLAGGEMRIGEHVLGAEDPAGRDAAGVQLRQQVVRGQR